MLSAISRPLAAALAGSALHGTVALAQPAECGKPQEMLEERRAFVAAVNAGSKSAITKTPEATCALFGDLQRNGTIAIAWIETHRAWCAIPDAFAERFKADQMKTLAIGDRACGLVRPAPLQIDPLPAHPRG